MFGKLGAVIGLAALIGACTPLYGKVSRDDAADRSSRGWTRETRRIGNKVTIDVFTR